MFFIPTETTLWLVLQSFDFFRYVIRHLFLFLQFSMQGFEFLVILVEEGDT
jgi:hypothetical protein